MAETGRRIFVDIRKQARSPRRLDQGTDNAGMLGYMSIYRHHPLSIPFPLPTPTRTRAWLTHTEHHT